MAKRVHNVLTDLAVRKAKPRTKTYRLHDGAGLALCVLPSGVKSWQFRYKLDGKDQTATLGPLEGARAMSLTAARKAAALARALADEGRHVTTEKRIAKARNRAKAAATFGAVSARWVERQARRKQWTEDYRQEVEASLTNHLATLHPLPLADISAALVTPILERVERRTPDMARKVEQRLQGIMDYGVRRGLIPVNPLPRPDPERKDGRKHMPAVLDREGVGEILREAEKAELSRGVRRAHLLTVFTAQRIGEIVPAEWSEIDLRAGTWTIPRARMKRKDSERGPHFVPLPPKIIALMREWHREDGNGAVYVCPAPNRDGHVTREAVEKLYRRGLGLANQHSPHSWRSVFSSWSRDAGKEGDVIEAQLDHVVGNKVAAAYDRAMRVERRRALVTWYESQLIAARDGAEVVQLKHAIQRSKR